MWRKEAVFFPVKKREEKNLVPCPHRKYSGIQNNGQREAVVFRSVGHSAFSTQNSTVQYSTAQHSKAHTAQHSTAKRITAQRSIILYSKVQCSTLLYSTTEKYSIVQYSTVWCSVHVRQFCAVHL
jgi:hypothetical protein